MPRLPGISQKEAVRAFQKLGHRQGCRALASAIPRASLMQLASLFTQDECPRN
jgi:hypothetical protein